MYIKTEKPNHSRLLIPKLRGLIKSQVQSFGLKAKMTAMSSDRIKSPTCRYRRATVGNLSLFWFRSEASGFRSVFGYFVSKSLLKAQHSLLLSLREYTLFPSAVRQLEPRSSVRSCTCTSHIREPPALVFICLYSQKGFEWRTVWTNQILCEWSNNSQI